jgi:hypothetical protein
MAAAARGRAFPEFDHLAPHDTVVNMLRDFMAAHKISFSALNRRLGLVNSFLSDGHPRLALRYRYQKFAESGGQNVTAVPPPNLLVDELTRYELRGISRLGRPELCRGDVPDGPEGAAAAASAIAAFSARQVIVVKD